MCGGWRLPTPAAGAGGCLGSAKRDGREGLPQGSSSVRAEGQRDRSTHEADTRHQLGRGGGPGWVNAPAGKERKPCSWSGVPLPPWWVLGAQVNTQTTDLGRGWKAGRGGVG